MLFVKIDDKPYFYNLGVVYPCEVTSNGYTVDFDNPMKEAPQLDCVYDIDSLKKVMGIVGNVVVSSLVEEKKVEKPKKQVKKRVTKAKK